MKTDLNLVANIIEALDNIMPDTEIVVSSKDKKIKVEIERK